MRIAALYDIHGNLPALDAVLSELARLPIDLILVGGDVYPGPMAPQVLDRLMTSHIELRALRGNGERTVLEHRDGRPSDKLPPEVQHTIACAASKLQPEHEREIRAWPASQPIDVPDLGRVLFVHATPTSDTDIFTERTADDVLRRYLGDVDADVLICGHTHIQFDRTISHLRIVNAGSVGMPFGDPGAHWLLIDGGLSLRRTDYDTQAAATVLRGADYPDVENFVTRYVLNQPSRSSMLEAYRGAQIV